MNVAWAEWYYLIYLLPFGLSFLMFLFSALSGGGHDDGNNADADASHGFHADADVSDGMDADASHGMDADISHGLDADVSHGMDADGGHDFHAGADASHGIDAHGGHGFHADADPSHSLAHGHVVDHAVHSHAVDHAHDPSHAVDHAHADSHAVDHSHAHAADAHAGSLLEFLGFGRAPITLLLQGFMLSWGVAGFYSTYLLDRRSDLPVAFVPPAMGIAFLSGLVGMKLVAAIGSRIMKPVESYALRREALVGDIGVVTYPVSETMGRVHVYDRHGSLHVESARVPPGCDPIPRNVKVLLIDYDPDAMHYLVEKSPL